MRTVTQPSNTDNKRRKHRMCPNVVLQSNESEPRTRLTGRIVNARLMNRLLPILQHKQDNNSQITHRTRAHKRVSAYRTEPKP